MPVTTLTRDDLLALKALSREAVRHCGGAEAVAAAAPYARSTVSDWGNINEGKTMPVAALVEICRLGETVEPLRRLAGLLGCRVEIEASAAPVPPLDLARATLGLGARLGQIAGRAGDELDDETLAKLAWDIADLGSQCRAFADRVMQIQAQRRAARP